ncbi:MAG: hypothetical protein Q9207_005680 [Kuettlingeria erythrocarpa]
MLRFRSANDARETRNNTKTIVTQCDDLKKKNTEISDRCTQLHAQNVEISKQCTELRNQNVEIKKQLQEQQAQLIEDRLSSLRRQLEIRRGDEEKRKSQYETKLRNAFNFHQKQVPNFDDALRHLEKNRAFASWVNSPSSAVVVLSGYSSAIAPGQRFCWLSAAAISFINRKRSSECPIAFFHGQQGTTIAAWRERSIDKEALHSIIVQIAGLDPCCLQTINVQQQVEHKDWGASGLEMKVALLQELLDLRPASEPVYLVFDNVGAAQGTLKDDHKGPPLVLLRRLAEMVRDTKAVVKVMFVGLDTDFEEKEVEIIRNTVGGLSPEHFALVNIKPLLPGHVLVSPRRVAKRLADLDNAEVTDLFVTVQQVGRMVERFYGASSLNIAIQDGPAAGQSVPHLHTHIIPRQSADLDEQGGGDAIYGMLESDDGDVGRQLWERSNSRSKFPKVDDSSRKPRSEEEMTEEAETLAHEMRQQLLREGPPQSSL